MPMGRIAIAVDADRSRASPRARALAEGESVARAANDVGALCDMFSVLPTSTRWPRQEELLGAAHDGLKARATERFTVKAGVVIGCPP